jgi:HD superfamily phosphohydrolase
MAALCHDIGHLPFSHVAEKDLLPEGWDHERITRELVLSNEMRGILLHMAPPLDPESVAKLAVGLQKSKEPLSDWETLLSEIIVGDAFGVDRMDYLLRDSYHGGVGYGKFDHYRLIDTLRILPSPDTGEPELGVQEGGVQSAEALLLARYFMYTQVYFHPIVSVYAIHLLDFLKLSLLGSMFPTQLEEILRLTDHHVMTDLLDAASDASKAGHDPARRIVEREHFRRLYYRHPGDIEQNPDAVRAIFEAAKQEFGENNVRYLTRRDGGGAIAFPVQRRDGRIVSSVSVSETLSKLPVTVVEYVFVAPEKLPEAEAWLEKNRTKLVRPTVEG